MRTTPIAGRSGPAAPGPVAAASAASAVELAELRTALRDLFAKRSPMSVVRRDMARPTTLDRDLWRALVDLGVAGLGVSEARGGSGGGFVAVAVALEEGGSSLTTAPLLATLALAVPALLAVGADEHLAAVIAGETVVTRLTRGRASADANTVTGSYPAALDAAVADLILLVADSTLYALDPAARGLTVEPLTTLDPTRRLAAVRLERTPATALGRVDAARLHDVAVVALAAEQVGVARRCLEMSVEHARTRIQFGRPIGSFQAVKHMVADMLVRVEIATAACEEAVAGLDGAGDISTRAPVAAAYCSDAAYAVAAATIQVHGGMGFTWEHDAHLYFKRATAGRVLFGSPAVHRASVADRIGL